MADTIELATTFADASLEMDEAGEKFRVGLALQTAVASSTATANEALEDAGAAQDGLTAHVGSGGASHALATDVVDGFLSKEGFTKLAALGGMHFARVTISGTVAVSGSAGWRKIPFNSVSYDPAGLWSAVNQNFKPTRPGLYLVTVHARTNVSLVDTVATGLNGVETRALGAVRGASGALIASGGSSVFLLNGTTDVVDGRAWLDAGAGNWTGNVFDTYMEIMGPFV